MTQARPSTSRLTALIDRFEPLRILRRRWLTFALTSAAFVGLAVAGYVVTPPKFSATGSVMVDDTKPGVSNVQTNSDLKVGDPADMESQLIVARSQRVIRRALASPLAINALNVECNASKGDGFGGSCADLAGRVDKLIEYAADRYSIVGVGRSRVISISYTSGNPQVAADMANALIDAFLEDQKDAAAKDRENAAGPLRDEASKLDAEIKKLDDEIVEYRTSNGLVRGANAPFSAERLSSVGQELAAAQAAQATASAQLKELNAAKTGGSASSAAILESRTVGDLKQRLSEIQVDMANAEATLGPAHPRWKALADQARTLKAQMQTEVDRLSRSVQKQYDAATLRVEMLTARMQASKVDVANSVAAERNIESLVRDAEVKRKKYADIAERINVLETEQRVISGNIRKVSDAEAPLKPFLPKLTPFLAAGLMLGLLFGFLAAFLVDRLFGSNDDERVGEVPPGGRRPVPEPNPYYDAAANAAAAAAARRAGEGLRVVAVMPQLRTQAANGHPGQTLFAALNASAAEPKALQALENMARAIPSANANPQFGATLLMTSPAAGGGKTLTSLALARHMAAKGMRVAVIECNRGAPLISDAMGLPPNYNWRTADIGALAIKSPFPQLDIFACGRANRQLPPGEWDRLLLQATDWAMRRYDLVILDGAPCDAADTLRLLPYANAVALCVAENELQSPATEAAIARIRSAGHGEISVIASAARFATAAPFAQSPVRQAARRR